MKNKQSKGLSLSVNPKHSISGRFKASTRGFCHFLKKFESEWNTVFSAVLKHFFSVTLKHLTNVILGFIPRIHAKSTPMDTRVTPKDDNRKNFTKGLDVVCQCAALLERRVQSSTRVRKAQTVTKQTNECIETTESGVDKVVSSCEKNPNVHKTYMNFLRQRKTALDAPLHAVSSGRSMIEMLGVLAIIGVLSVGGIQGYSKAMDMYHWNKALGQWRLIINLMNIYEPQLHINNSSDVGELSLIPILRATGDLPEEMLVNEDYTVVDALGSSLYIYAHNTGYVGIASFNQKDNYTACRLFFTIGQYYHDMIDVIQIYTNDPNKDPSNGNKQFIGDKYCGASSKNCLKDLGVAQITDLCKNNKVCNGMTSCHYLMYWLSH